MHTATNAYAVMLARPLVGYMWTFWTADSQMSSAVIKITICFNDSSVLLFYVTFVRLNKPLCKRTIS